MFLSRCRLIDVVSKRTTATRQSQHLDIKLLLTQRLLALSNSARSRIKQVVLKLCSQINNKACGLVCKEAADCL